MTRDMTFQPASMSESAYGTRHTFIPERLQDIGDMCANSPNFYGILSHADRFHSSLSVTHKRLFAKCLTGVERWWMIDVSIHLTIEKKVLSCLCLPRYQAVLCR